MFGNIFKGRRVLITGHTGFKGSWLALWLLHLGADVIGYSVDVPTEPSHHRLLNLDMETIFGDIRDREKLEHSIATARPDIVFHLAAQSLVRRSYKNPVETFDVNVMGTIRVLEACRRADSVKAVVVATSDKCYRNNENSRDYCEEDHLGGYDPYSASKACAELATAAFRDSFFSADIGHPALIATTRAGNVIGGGDWAEDRLIPDVALAVNNKEIMKIRNPQGLRPWQHVLEPLSGYLMLGQYLLEGKRVFADAWNFGPSEDDTLPVMALLERLKKHWPGLEFVVDERPDQPHEAGLLRLNSSKARQKIGWRPVWGCDQTLEKTAAWYQAFYNHGEIPTGTDLAAYIESARSRGLTWAR